MFLFLLYVLKNFSGHNKIGGNAPLWLRVCSCISVSNYKRLGNFGQNFDSIFKNTRQKNWLLKNMPNQKYICQPPPQNANFESLA